MDEETRRRILQARKAEAAFMRDLDRLAQMLERSGLLPSGVEFIVLEEVQPRPEEDVNEDVRFLRGLGISPK